MQRQAGPSARAPPGAGSFLRGASRGSVALLAFLAAFSAYSFMHTHYHHDLLHQSSVEQQHQRSQPQEQSARESAGELPELSAAEEADGSDIEWLSAEVAEVEEQRKEGTGDSRPKSVPVEVAEADDASRPEDSLVISQEEEEEEEEDDKEGAVQQQQQKKQEEVMADSDSHSTPPPAVSFMRTDGESIQDALAQMDSILDTVGDNPNAIFVPKSGLSQGDQEAQQRQAAASHQRGGLISRVSKGVSSMLRRKRASGANKAAEEPARGGQQPQQPQKKKGWIRRVTEKLSVRQRHDHPAALSRDSHSTPAPEAAVSEPQAQLNERLSEPGSSGELLGNPRDDDLQEPCSPGCRPHGFCVRGQCICVAAWTGPSCDRAKAFPQGLRSNFTGQFILNQKSVVESNGISVRTNPKASAEIEHGRTHTLFAPYEDKEDKKQDQLFRRADTPLSKLRTVITRGQLMLLPEDDFMSNKLYNTCAIVGNSGLNLVHKDGPTIDAMDAVFRFNSAPTKPPRKRQSPTQAGGPVVQHVDFPSHVGSKTSFRFINTQHITFHEGSEWRFQQMQSKNGLFRYFNFKTRHRNSHLAGFDSDFTNYVNSNIPTLPTGGYFAIMFAIQRCHHVAIYGFHWREGHSIPHHYFNSEEPLKGAEMIHDYAAEHGNLEALAQAGVVELAQPCVAGCPADTGIPCPRCAAGSACACGDNLPMPMSLPGFCHLHKEYKCFYKCPGGAKQCPGGPKTSRCPREFDISKVRCASPGDVPEGLVDRTEWTRKGYSGGGVKKADMSRFGHVSVGKMRDTSDVVADIESLGLDTVCTSESCRQEKHEYKRLAAVAKRAAAARSRAQEYKVGADQSAGDADQQPHSTLRDESLVDYSPRDTARAFTGLPIVSAAPTALPFQAGLPLRPCEDLACQQFLSQQADVSQDLEALWSRFSGETAEGDRMVEVVCRDDRSCRDRVNAALEASRGGRGGPPQGGHQASKVENVAESLNATKQSVR